MLGDEINDFLLVGCRDIEGIDDVLAELGRRLVAGGIPIERASLHLRTRHPEWLGARIVWRRGRETAEINRVAYDVAETDAFFSSPFYAILQGAEEVRERLYRRARGPWRYLVFEELKKAGLTDYIAWPLEHMLGTRQLVTFASDAPQGFSDVEVGTLKGLLPVLSLLSESRLKGFLAATFLETYVGPHAARQILAGATTRGSGTSVDAAILFCDLNGFSELSAQAELSEILAELNHFFDCVTAPIEAHGGEVLKFIGDGLLAIFPTAEPNACRQLLRAVAEMEARVAAHSAAPGHRPLGYGIGIHVGEVMYGNIGAGHRLDFTVIGPAVNVAARLEQLAKGRGDKVLMSAAFVEAAGCQTRARSLGQHALKGFAAPIEVFALEAETP